MRAIVVYAIYVVCVVYAIYIFGKKEGVAKVSLVSFFDGFKKMTLSTPFSPFSPRHPWLRLLAETWLNHAAIATLATPRLVVMHLEHLEVPCRRQIASACAKRPRWTVCILS